MPFHLASRLSVILGALSIWTGASAATYTLQPNPTESQDIWTTSVFSYVVGNSGPGGGLANDILRVGGWADEYYSLLQFKLNGSPNRATSATLRLYTVSRGNANPTGMYL